jgi:TolB-like protein/DNA-binding winged helix-turn-helix (wHTH) protein/Flp pilus assembly protein TadD
MNTQAKASGSYQFGPYHVDTAAGQLRKHGTKIRLAGQPFEILGILLERAGQVVTREELQERLWSRETFVDFENSLNKAINKLRQALADSAGQPAYIETLPRRGYRFIGAIQRSAASFDLGQIPFPTPNAARAASENATAASVASPEVKEQRGFVVARPRANWARSWLGYGLLLAALSISVWFVASRWPKHQAYKAITSVAVLPLEYFSSEPGQDYFADGVTDELITQLAKSGAFRVTSRTSSMQFKKTNKSLPQIARELGVDALVEGSIERAGARIRIRAELIQASTDQHLWAESYDGEVNDVLSLEDRVARDIAQKVVVNLTPAQARKFVRTHAVNPDAHLDYLRGRFYWNQRTADGFDKAQRFFQAAIDKDPNYAAAYAGLADTYVLSGASHSLSENEMIPKARAAAQRALQIESLSEAHTSLGLIAQNYDWDWKTAEKEYRLAIELNPSYSTAHHWYGEAFLGVTGRFDEALAEMKVATELDPLSPIISTDLGVTLYLARRYEGAIQHLSRTLELYPDYQEARTWLARSYEQERRCPEAISLLDDGNISTRTLFKDAERARIYAECGRPNDSLRILGDLQKLSSTQFVDPAILGGIFIGLGRKNDALSQLESSIQVHSTALTSLKVLPIYDPLRSDPRFAALLRAVHLTQ